MTVNSLRGAAPLEFGNGRVERFHLRLIVPLLRETRLPSPVRQGKMNKSSSSDSLYSCVYHQRDPLGTLRSEYIPSPPPLALPAWVRMCLFNSALLPNIVRQTLHRQNDGDKSIVGPLISDMRSTAFIRFTVFPSMFSPPKQHYQQNP